MLCGFVSLKKVTIFFYKKVDLGFPKKIEHRLHVDSVNMEMINELVESRDKHKLKVSGNKEEISVFRKSALLKAINKAKNIYFDPIITGGDFELLSSKIDQKIKGNYIQVLETLISQEENDELDALFKEISMMV